MNDRIRQRLARGIAVAAALLFAAPAVALAQQGSVTGTVKESSTGRPIEAAQVNVVGTTLGAVTAADGKYTIRGVPTGTQQLRALRVGYQESKVAVSITAGQATTHDFTLSTVAISLAPVVTTATGEQRRVEIGNSVTQIDAAKVNEASPISSVNDMLNSRAPGVVVTSGTQTGAGARIRIRGQSSISLSNDPIYVIDGVRMTSNTNSSNLFTGGAQPSRVGDINPDDIESIEIVKGPSAATLYGTDAANGVIVITTKKGRSGQAQWAVHGESGLLEDRNNYPTAYTIFGKQPGATNEAALNFCNLPRVSSGACATVDSVAAYSPFKDKDVTPLKGGSRYAYGAQVRGGSDLVTYFVTGNKENETGVLGLPDFERRRLEESKLPIREWTDRPNTLARNSFRVNLNATPNSKLDLGLQTGYFNVDQRFSNESNATAGLGSQIFGGPGCKICSPDRTVSGTGSPLYGYRAWTPGYSWQEKLQQRVDRFVGGASINYRPTSWWANRAQFGTDLTDRVDDNFLYNGEGPPINSTYQQGFKDNTRTNLRSLTADIASTISWSPRSWLGLKSTGGVQYVSYSFEMGEAYGENLPPGAQTAGSGATPSSAESTTLTKTLGLYLNEDLAINDRLYLTGAVRTDQNSAFGTNFQRVFYPKASLSWIVSDESFFPRWSWLNSMRLRAAFGAAGVQPGPNDALRSFTPLNANVGGADEPAIVSSLAGNTDLKPERSTEWEGGFETKLFGGRASLDFTAYRKRTKDALIDAILAPSYGVGSRTVKQNLGAIQNQGIEVSVNTQIIDRKAIGFDLTLNGSVNGNEVVSPRRHAAADRDDEPCGRGLSDQRALGQADHGLAGQEQGRDPHVQRGREPQRGVRGRQRRVPRLCAAPLHHDRDARD